MNRLFLLILTGAGLLVTAASAQIAIRPSGASGAAEFNLADAYVQTFDTLPAPVTTTFKEAENLAWTNNVTLRGWFRYVAGSGGVLLADRSASGAFGGAPVFYNYGADARADRALGLRGSKSPGSDGAIGVVFVNRTQTPLARVTLAYRGEQWRRNSATAHSVLQVGYCHLDKKFDAGRFNVSKQSGWTVVPALQFTAPQLGGGRSLDGNAADNRHEFAATEVVLDTPLAPGEFLAIRWYYPALGETGQGLALDDVTVRFVAAAR